MNVEGNMYFQTLSGENNDTFVFQGTSPSIKFIGGAADSGGFDFYQGGIRRAQFQYNDVGDNLRFLSNYGGLQFSTDDDGSATERMYINSDGNIGIGDTSPDAALEIVTNAAGETYLMISSKPSTDGDIFIVDSNGNVGIGDTTPDASLEIVTSGDDPVFMLSRGLTGDGDLFYVDAEGQVGIGTNSPSYPLHVPWQSGDTTTTAYFGSSSANNDQVAVYGRSYSTYGMQGQSTDSIGVYGLSTNSYGLYGTSVAGYGVYGISTNSIGSRGYSVNSHGGEFVTSPTSTTGVEDIIRLIRSTSATAADGIGGSIDWQLENMAGENELSGKIANILTTVTDSSEKSAFAWYTRDAADDGVVERMRLDHHGNLGIGDTTPDYKLEVLDTTTQLTLTYVDGTETRFFTDINGDLHIEPTGGDIFTPGNISGAKLLSTDLTKGSVVFAGDGGELSQDNPNFYWDDTNKRLGIGDTSPDAMLEIATSSTNPNYFMISEDDDGDGNIFIVDSSGNVGIGTITPSYKVEIAQSAHDEGLLVRGFDDRDSSTGLFKVDEWGNIEFVADIGGEQGLNFYSAGLIRFQANTLTTSSGQLVLQNNGDVTMIDGNVGINDTTPDYKLEVLDTTTQFTLTNVDGTQDAEFFVNSSGDLEIAPSGGNVSFGYYIFPDADGSSGQYLKTDGSGNISWDAPAGSGDILKVGDCESGDCFDGSASGGTQLTFYDAGGNGILSYDGGFEFDQDLEIIDTVSQLVLTYDDGVDYVDFFVDDNGDLHMEPSGGNVSFGPYMFPSADGTNGQFLSTDGSGIISWATSAGSGDITRVGSMADGETFYDSNADDQWLGLGVSAGRIEFDDLVQDEVNILAAMVGIGDDAPDASLEVTTIPGASAYFMVSSAAGNDGDYFIVDGSGKIGMGDITPDAVLEITTSTAGDDYFYISTNAGLDGDIFKVDSAGDINFDSGTMFVDAFTNYVGIGTSNPGRELDV